MYGSAGQPTLATWRVARREDDLLHAQPRGARGAQRVAEAAEAAGGHGAANGCGTANRNECALQFEQQDHRLSVWINVFV